MAIVKQHECEGCSSEYKRHVLGHWREIINEKLPQSKKVTNTKSLSKIFRILKHEGIFSESFLIGRKKVKVDENFYIYQKIYK